MHEHLFRCLAKVSTIRVASSGLCSSTANGKDVLWCGNRQQRGLGALRCRHQHIAEADLAEASAGEESACATSGPTAPHASCRQAHNVPLIQE